MGLVPASLMLCRGKLLVGGKRKGPAGLPGLSMDAGESLTDQLDSLGARCGFCDQAIGVQNFQDRLFRLGCRRLPTPRNFDRPGPRRGSRSADGEVGRPV